MNWIFFIVAFILSCFALSWLSSHLIKSLTQVAKYLRWREFIVAFFVMAFAASLPNLMVDVSAALNGMPNLAFGDIIGGNLVDLTLVMAIAIFFSKNSISTKSEMVQKSAIFTAIIAVLPLLLILDSSLGRIDGIILIGTFFVYSFWLFSKKENFQKPHNISSVKAKEAIGDFKSFLWNFFKIIILLAFLLAASQVIVSFAQFFSTTLGISLSLVGVLILGLGNCFPEMYFAVISARKQENWMVLGDLMGSVIVCSTLVLGVVALVTPFEILDFSPFLIARAFLIVGSLCAWLFIRSGREITKKEGLLLLSVYILFLLVEVVLR